MRRYSQRPTRHPEHDLSAKEVNVNIEDTRRRCIVLRQALRRLEQGEHSSTVDGRNEARMAFSLQSENVLQLVDWVEALLPSTVNEGR